MRKSYRQSNIPIPLTRNDISKMINGAKTEKVSLLIQFLYSSGLRIMEVVNIRKEDLFLNLNKGIVRKGKGKKQRMFYISKSLSLQLKKFVQSTKGKYLFNFAIRSEPGTYRYFKNGVRQIQRTLKKVKEDARIMKKASPHKFRHSYATHLYQDGTDILKIKELLGHSHITNTLMYTYFT